MPLVLSPRVLAALRVWRAFDVLAESSCSIENSQRIASQAVHIDLAPFKVKYTPFVRCPEYHREYQEIPIFFKRARDILRESSLYSCRGLSSISSVAIDSRRELPKGATPYVLLL